MASNTKRKTKPSKAAATAKKMPKSRSLELVRDGRSQDELLADAAASPVVRNALTVALFSEAQMGDVSLTDLVKSLKVSADKLVSGDMSEAETLLATQAVALNVMFGELSHRAAMNMGEYMGATETYLKLALRAQSQSRATLETLSAIKNPPVVFAKQANIAHGHQQVNNGVAEDVPEPDTRTRENVKPQNKLLRSVK